MSVTATSTYENGKLTLTLECGCGGTPVPQPAPSPAPAPTFEANADLTAYFLRPPTSAWYQRVDGLPVHPRSAEIIASQPPVVASIGPRLQNDFGPDIGMPYSAGSGHPPVPVGVLLYPSESDPGPHPIPLGAPIEDGSDRHLLYFDNRAGKLYELFNASKTASGFACDSAAVWDAALPDDQRPLGWTSADAAGLPILPGLVRFDEFAKALSQSDLAKQHLGHALRFTLPNTGHGFIAPARHYASSVSYALPGRPPMGMRCRLNPQMDLSDFNPPTQVLLRTLQLYGAILSDNGASWFFTGTRDARWGQYFDDITGMTPGGLGFKNVSGALFASHWQVVNFADSDVVTQV